MSAFGDVGGVAGAIALAVVVVRWALARMDKASQPAPQPSALVTVGSQVQSQSATPANGCMAAQDHGSVLARVAEALSTVKEDVKEGNTIGRQSQQILASLAESSRQMTTATKQIGEVLIAQTELLRHMDHRQDGLEQLLLRPSVHDSDPNGRAVG